MCFSYWIILSLLIFLASARFEPDNASLLSERFAARTYSGGEIFTAIMIAKTNFRKASVGRVPRHPPGHWRKRVSFFQCPGARGVRLSDCLKTLWLPCLPARPVGKGQY